MGTCHVSRSSLEPKVYYSRIDDIDKVSPEAATLKSRIVEFLIGPKSEWPRYSSAILGHQGRIGSLSSEDLDDPTHDGLPAHRVTELP